MKKFTLSALLLLVAVYTQAQHVILTGKVSNPQSDSVLVAMPQNPFNSQESRTYAALNEKGEFKLALNVATPVLADLVNGSESITLFLQPGDNMEVKFNADDIVKTIKFQGKGAAENSYIREFEQIFEENDGYQLLPDNIYMREAQFVKFIDARKEDHEDFLTKFSAKKPLSEAFLNYAKAQIEFTWANDRLTFPDLREQIVFAEKRLVMTPAYYSFLNTLNLNNPAAFICPVYNEFTENYVEYLTAEAKVKPTDQEYFLVCYNLAKTKFTGAAQNLLQARFLYKSCKTGHIGFTNRMLEDYTRSNKGSIYMPFIQEEYNASKKFAMGSPAPNFTFTTITGDTVSLEDYKGKLVYLSFWETNCGLCLMDMPFTQELTKKMQGRDIVFININVDKNEKTWRDMVSKKQLLGVHANIKSANQNVAATYEIKEAPTYFLIAEDGTFLNTKPKRPSSHGVSEEIAQAFGRAANIATALKSK